MDAERVQGCGFWFADENMRIVDGNQDARISLTFLGRVAE
jgi:hypothetical protein